MTWYGILKDGKVTKLTTDLGSLKGKGEIAAVCHPGLAGTLVYVNERIRQGYRNAYRLGY
jgi:hypothetical protein